MNRASNLSLKNQQLGFIWIAKVLDGFRVFTLQCEIRSGNMNLCCFSFCPMITVSTMTAAHCKWSSFQWWDWKTTKIQISASHFTPESENTENCLLKKAIWGYTVSFQFHIWITMLALLRVVSNFENLKRWAVLSWAWPGQTWLG
jgi:hypothetical protein